ncbi:MAG TPA: PhnD/SsuA/transferrin family substrate-binding protein [Ilumatobacteraceae bacterium]|jgi:ABC-type phosphate/phosphonate transport system substrate-binding protein
MTIASLAMYPFLPLRSAFERLWDGVRSRISFDAPELDWDTDPLVACRSADLLLGQTCGWPLVTDLATSVRVIGTLDCDVDGVADGTYCSVLVTGTGDDLDELLRREDLVVAANSDDSLSGWISLRSVAFDHGATLDRVLCTGAHLASLEAVRSGRAHLAAIDAISFAHLGGDGVTVVGHGPRVPCLPLVTAMSSSDATVDELRSAFAASVRDPRLADACAALKIRDFIVRDLSDYQGISKLTEVW